MNLFNCSLLPYPFHKRTFIKLYSKVMCGYVIDCIICGLEYCWRDRCVSVELLSVHAGMRWGNENALDLLLMWRATQTVSQKSSSNLDAFLNENMRWAHIVNRYDALMMHFLSHSSYCIWSTKAQYRQNTPQFEIFPSRASSKKWCQKC